MSAIEINLACGHVMRYDPMPKQGDIVWCQSCGKYRRVTSGTANPVARIQCVECTYRRNLYTNLEDAKLRAETHSLGNDHLVQVFDQSNELQAEYAHGELIALYVPESNGDDTDPESGTAP